eukprot:TRINITY_DN111570_c0_g1_i1.p1 TRINITY_DN111570_c0_g1~~TRINITY_DN111570_c0_g1_i1.p1  ORF type:complete len:258 (+),score=46.27 TRINITY_DN111570_c0_g1_i1:32-775(+)
MAALPASNALPTHSACSLTVEPRLSAQSTSCPGSARTSLGLAPSGGAYDIKALGSSMSSAWTPISASSSCSKAPKEDEFDESLQMEVFLSGLGSAPAFRESDPALLQDRAVRPSPDLSPSRQSVWLRGEVHDESLQDTVYLKRSGAAASSSPFSQGDSFSSRMTDPDGPSTFVVDDRSKNSFSSWMTDPPSLPPLNNSSFDRLEERLVCQEDYVTWLKQAPGTGNIAPEADDIDVVELFPSKGGHQS